jgi:hypothetical protein
LPNGASCAANLPTVKTVRKSAGENRPAWRESAIQAAPEFESAKKLAAKKSAGEADLSKRPFKSAKNLK